MIRDIFQWVQFGFYAIGFGLSLLPCLVFLISFIIIFGFIHQFVAAEILSGLFLYGFIYRITNMFGIK